ncbi:MAG: CBS domain-containing protein [Rhodospirillaceae bacterium]
MTIAHVLEKKGKAIYSVSPDAIISSIIIQYSKNRAGSLLVIDERGRVLGFLTERDIIKSLGAIGAKTLEARVSDLMTKANYKCSPQDSIARALEIMGRKKTRYLPVVERARLIGVISMVDLVEAKMDLIQADAEWMMEYISGDYCITYDSIHHDKLATENA